jgi:dCTP deaminase
MLLSKPAIIRYRNLGKITIEPFVMTSLGSSQYDVTLGDNFYRESEVYTGDLYNPYDEKQVRQKWVLNKAISHEDWIERSGVPLENIGPDEKLILIRPGELILAHTVEFIGGSCNSITTMMKARSSVGRNGLEVCRCAGMGDVGYFSRWTLEIANTGKHTLPLVVGRRIAQLLFMEVEPVDDADTYDKAGKYQTSKSLADLQAAWTPEQMLPKQWNDRESRAVRARGGSL